MFPLIIVVKVPLIEIIVDMIVVSIINHIIFLIPWQSVCIAVSITKVCVNVPWVKIVVVVVVVIVVPVIWPKVDVVVESLISVVFWALVLVYIVYPITVNGPLVKVNAIVIVLSPLGITNVIVVIIVV